jgi:predicted dehydrogenase
MENPQIHTTRSTPLRIIQVGMGGFGRNWYQTKVAPLAEVESMAFVEPVEQTREQCIRELGIKRELIFDSLEHAISAVSADAVLITASLPGHVPNARDALMAGKHVLMEKPFAPSVADARQLVELAATRERVLMISQNYRFFPAPQLAAQIVANGTLGRLGVVHVDFRRDHVTFDEGRRRHYELSHPLLADMAIHHFDLMRMICGADAGKVRCHAFQPPWSHYKDPPAAEAVIEMENGVVVTYRGSWVSSGSVTPWAGEWNLEFEKGELWFTSRGDDTPKADELWIRKLGKKPQKQTLPRLPGTDRTGSLLEFVSSVRETREPLTSGARNIGSIGLTYAAIESAGGAGWVTVER